MPLTRPSVEFGGVGPLAASVCNRSARRSPYGVVMISLSESISYELCLGSAQLTPRERETNIVAGWACDNTDCHALLEEGGTGRNRIRDRDAGVEEEDRAAAVGRERALAGRPNRDRNRPLAGRGESRVR